MDAPKLNALRQEIDVDRRDLHGLIRRRAALVGEITASKPPGGLALRPGREATVMRQRLAAHEGAFPAAAVYRMWREMMSAFSLMQTPALKVAVCRPADQPGYWDLARDHFGCQVPLLGYESPMQVLAEVRANPTTIGVLPAPIETDTAPWWPLLASGEPTLPNVVARLPFLVMPNARARGTLGAGAGPHRARGERRGSRADLGRSAGGHQPQPHRRRPDQGRAAALLLGHGPGGRPACITICSSCRT